MTASSIQARQYQGVLLVNLGTPDDASAAAIRRYLSEFLSDPRVTNIPRLAWLLLLYCVIVPFSPKRLVEKYSSAATQNKPSKPSYNHALAEATQKALETSNHTIRVMSATTYGNPSIETGLDTLQSESITDVLIIPLFPRYSAATTTASYEKLASVLAKKKSFSSLMMINQYFAEPNYINALATAILKKLEKFQNIEKSDVSSYLAEDTKLLFCFRGIPKTKVDNGDPYPRQCMQTAESVVEKLKLRPDQWLLTYQSPAGAAEWQQPYANETLRNLPAKGVRNLFVICPGIAADGLDTIEALKVENKAIFIDAGGFNYNDIACINDQDSHVELVKAQVLDSLNIV